MVRIYDSVDYPLLYLGLYERAIECLLVRQECNKDKIMLSVKSGVFSFQSGLLIRSF